MAGMNLNQGRYLEVSQFARVIQALDKIASELEEINKRIDQVTEGPNGPTQQE